MSEYDGHEDERDVERGERRHSEATVHLPKWSPWVWIIPALAVFFVGYLIVRYGFFGGGDITVKFAEARGLDRYSPVRFRGAKVGTVQKITIDDDLKGVLVRISLDASMNHALKRNLDWFWYQWWFTTHTVDHAFLDRGAGARNRRHRRVARRHLRRDRAG